MSWIVAQDIRTWWTQVNRARTSTMGRSAGARWHPAPSTCPAIEGYPDLVEGGYVGTPETFRQAGFVTVSQPSKRKLVMRLDF